jgi:sugar phosphate isomerase/epimerase
MRAYTSTFNRVKVPIKECLEWLIDGGITRVEISSGHRYEDGFWDTVKELRNEHGLDVILHNFAPPLKEDLLLNLSSREPGKVKATQDFIISRIGMSREIGARFYGFHAGFLVEYYFGQDSYDDPLPHDRGMDMFIDNLGPVLDAADDQDIDIAIENHVVEEKHRDILYLAHHEDFRHLFDKVRSKRLFALIDLGHLQVSSRTLGFDPFEFLKVVGKRALEYHIHGNDFCEDVHRPITSDFEFLGYLRGLRNEDVAVTLETRDQPIGSIRSMLSLLEGE